MKDIWKHPLAVALFPLALAGLTGLAFAEPPIYHVLSYILMAMILLIYFIGAVWSAAVTFTNYAAMRAIAEFKPEKESDLGFGVHWKIQDAVEQRTKKLEMPGWATPLFLVLIVYLIALDSVPMLRERFEKPVNAHDTTHSKTGPKT